MTDPLICAECETELTTADAEDAVKTDAGPVHRECFEGPVPPDSLPAGYLLPPGKTMADVRAMDAELLASEGGLSVDGPAFTVGKYGSTFSFTPETGWLVNGEPYNPDDDGVHQPMASAEIEAENERRQETGDRPLTPEELGPHCPECGDPVDEPGRCFTCRGKSMQP